MTLPLTRLICGACMSSLPLRIASTHDNITPSCKLHHPGAEVKGYAMSQMAQLRPGTGSRHDRNGAPARAQPITAGWLIRAGERTRSRGRGARVAVGAFSTR